jgi:hypothetical protein
MLITVGDGIPSKSQIRAFARDLCLLDRTRRGREHRIGVATNHADRAYDDHENDGEHDGVFGDILPLVIGPETTEKGEDHIVHQPWWNFGTGSIIDTAGVIRTDDQSNSTTRDPLGS